MNAPKSVIAVCCFIGSVGAFSEIKSMWDLPIKKVSSQVFNPEELPDIARELGIVIGKPVNPSGIERKAKQWYGTKIESLMVEGEVVKGGLEITIRGNRKRRLRTLVFKNTEPELQAEVRNRFSLAEGSRIDSRTLSLASEFLSESLRAQGFFKGEVNINVTDVPRSDESIVELVVRPGEPSQIRNIILSGLSSEDAAEVRKLLEIRKGAPLRKKDVERSHERIVSYLTDNQFPLAQVESVSTTFQENAVDITINVKTGRKIQIEFMGNRVLDDLTLRETVTLSSVSDEDSRRQMVAAIEGKLRPLGFHFCRVRVEDEEKGDTLVRKIKIDEGAKVIIDKFHAVGLGSGIDPKTVEDIFFENAPGVLARRIYFEEGLEEARTNLEKVLKDLGYSKVRVNSVKPVFETDERGVQLFVEIETGVKSVVSSIVVKGNEHISNDEILALADLVEKMPYSERHVALAQGKLITAYQEKGFLDVRCEVKEKETSEQDANQVALEIEITEGMEYRVGEITVSGNAKTAESIILREMKLQPDDIFVPSKVRASEEDIGLLGIFSKVELTPHSSLKNPRQKDIKIVVVESRPGLGEVGVGAAYEDPRFRLRPFLGLAYRNLFGKNHTVSFRGELGFPISRDSFVPFLEYATVVGLRSPNPFELPFVFNAQIGIDRFELSPNASPSTTTPSGPQVANRARLEERIERKVSQVTTLYYRLHRFERSSTEDLKTGATTPADVIGSTGPGIIVDLRDNIFNPVTGSYHTLDLEYAHPALLSGDAIHFAMGIARNSFYLPFVAGTGLRFFAGLGYAKTMDDSLSVPKVRLLNEMALGGQLSIRGFLLRTFTPPTDAKDALFYNFRAELAFPIFGDYGGALFFDTGQIASNVTYGNRRNLDRHDGIGLGFRYKTPVGPFVVDLAHGIGDSEKVRFYFTLGNI